MTITKPQENTFNRVGIKYDDVESTLKVETCNRFTGETIAVHPLIARCIAWVYKTSNDYENGIQNVKISDFDRVRYFVAKEDNNAYMTCLD